MKTQQGWHSYPPSYPEIFTGLSDNVMKNCRENLTFIHHMLGWVDKLADDNYELGTKWLTGLKSNGKTVRKMKTNKIWRKLTPAEPLSCFLDAFLLFFLIFFLRIFTSWFHTSHTGNLSQLQTNFQFMTTILLQTDYIIQPLIICTPIIMPNCNCT